MCAVYSMYVRLCVCVYDSWHRGKYLLLIRVYTYLHTYTHTHTRTYVKGYVRTCIYTCMHATPRVAWAESDAEEGVIAKYVRGCIHMHAMPCMHTVNAEFAKAGDHCQQTYTHALVSDLNLGSGLVVASHKTNCHSHNN
jgi:hypothetical protein